MGVILTVTAKGQVTFRKELLEHLGAGPGDQLEVEMLPSGRVEVRVAPKEGIEGFFGCLKSPLAKAPSIEEMNDAIAAGWAGKS
ncbi:AbrB/MazE/SpoVT family DNA-binding domain-containing protein [Niveispirillum sp. KHB5.9]|uniref:AbrB/MazE/SpoVT family DNA-binding domain-containing protein n=1 Tax=Niveispirillum sp. KHB5.9 TaxID=3400269 RepID=UPI003A8A0D03